MIKNTLSDWTLVANKATKFVSFSDVNFSQLLFGILYNLAPLCGAQPAHPLLLVLPTSTWRLCSIQSSIFSVFPERSRLNLLNSILQPSGWSHHEYWPACDGFYKWPQSLAFLKFFLNLFSTLFWQDAFHWKFYWCSILIYS